MRIFFKFLAKLMKKPSITLSFHEFSRFSGSCLYRMEWKWFMPFPLWDICLPPAYIQLAWLPMLLLQHVQVLLYNILLVLSSLQQVLLVSAPYLDTFQDFLIA